MIRTLRSISKQEKEKFRIPRSVQQTIPIDTIWKDGIFKVGKNKYSKTFQFTDINYATASKEDKKALFLEYSDLLNSFDSGAVTKLTVSLRRMNTIDFEKEILLPYKGDRLDVYRKEYNDMLREKALGTAWFGRCF